MDKTALSDEIEELNGKIGLLRSTLEFVQIEFKEFLNDDPSSRRVRDKIRETMKATE